ncbi:hypothetical protein N8996_04415 [Candidatus Poseidonia alphae]|nr:hypothetical protein [Candidatus Poseidonia alphae]
MQVYGFYSQKQFENITRDNSRKERYIFWEKLDGTVVQVTEVTNNIDNFHYNFNDYINLGELKKWSHNLR